MKRSLNEVETGVKKAALGAGWPVGVAEDLSRAAALVCGAGQAGVEASLQALAEDQTGSLERDNDCVICSGLALIPEATAAFDLLGGEVVQEARFGVVQSPALLAALAEVAATDQGCGFQLMANDRAVVLGAELPTAGCAIVARRGPMVPIPSVMGAEIDENAWQALMALAAKTFVPASQQSRLGAGAGDLDSD